jgi:Rieske Fe-S protein
MKKESLPDRRKAFKKMGAWLVGGSGTLTLAYLALGREGPIDEWVRVAPVSDFPVNEIVARLVKVTAHGRWVDQRVDRGIYVRRAADDSLFVLSSICPHKDYNIGWKASLGTFICPGHKSAFDPEGRVLSGPSPRPMDSLEYKVENGILMVRYQKFKRALPTKEPFI